MTELDFSQFSLDEIKNWVSHHREEDLKKNISRMTKEQLGVAIAKIGEKTDPDWKKKTCAVVSGLADLQQLETVGKHLTLCQTLEILEKSRSWDTNSQQSKLPSLFVGIPHTLFSEMLFNPSSQHLDILKYESITEPIQHHLTLFIHQSTNEIKELWEKLQILEKEIQRINIEEITSREIKEIKAIIEEIRHQYLTLLEKTNHCLAIAWNTNRPDLVEKLSSQKEGCLHAHLYIGVPGSPIVKTSGLYETLNKRLNEIYGNTHNPQNIEALTDDEPVIEALSKFSVWYLQQYWEIGLLPKIHSQAQLDLDPNSHNEKERVSYRESLFAEVEANLHRLGLVTLQDLKEQEIYSRKGLLEFIQENQHRLKS